MAAAKNGFQAKVLEQVKEAEKRVQELEREVVVRARAQQKELKALVARIQSGKELKAWTKRANKAQADVKQRLTGLQKSFVSSFGVATSSQVAEINKELARLAKKVDGLAKKPVVKA